MKHRIPNPASDLPFDMSDDCLLIEWDGGWDTADDMDEAHAIAWRLGLGCSYTISVNEMNGELIYQGGDYAVAVDGGFVDDSDQYLNDLEAASARALRLRHLYPDSIITIIYP